ncbi:hypothetical protein [Sphingobium phenoxybenzoativorans]|nr:hypothetical protein [Sphingobium phenoxybenzoativorans]
MTVAVAEAVGDDGWIDWSGGDCPIQSKTVVIGRAILRKSGL